MLSDFVYAMTRSFTSVFCVVSTRYFVYDTISLATATISLALVFISPSDHLDGEETAFLIYKISDNETRALSFETLFRFLCILVGPSRPEAYRHGAFL